MGIHAHACMHTARETCTHTHTLTRAYVLLRAPMCLQLQVDPSECRLMLADEPMSTFAHRERAMQAAFETHGFIGLSIQPPAFLSLLSVGQQTVLVVDIGENRTTMVRSRRTGRDLVLESKLVPQKSKCGQNRRIFMHLLGNVGMPLMQRKNSTRCTHATLTVVKFTQCTRTSAGRCH